MFPPAELIYGVKVQRVFMALGMNGYFVNVPCRFEIEFPINGIFHVNVI